MEPIDIIIITIAVLAVVGVVARQIWKKKTGNLRYRKFMMLTVRFWQKKFHADGRELLADRYRCPADPDRGRWIWDLSVPGDAAADGSAVFI